MNNSGYWDYDYVVPDMSYPYQPHFDRGVTVYQNVALMDGAREGLPAVRCPPSKICRNLQIPFEPGG